MAPTHREDRWIISRLNRVADAVNSYLVHFELGEAQRELYEFIWHEYCDWYIELAKLRLRNGEGESPLPVLAHVLEQTLRLLHPFMPFITEEIWQRLKPYVPGAVGTCPSPSWCRTIPSLTRVPSTQPRRPRWGLVQDIITQVRNHRAEEKIPSGQQVEAIPSPSIAQVTKGVQGGYWFFPGGGILGGLRLSRVWRGYLNSVWRSRGLPLPMGTRRSMPCCGREAAEAHGFASARIWVPVAEAKAQGQDRSKLEKELSDLVKQIDRLNGAARERGVPVEGTGRGAAADGEPEAGASHAEGAVGGAVGVVGAE